MKSLMVALTAALTLWAARPAGAVDADARPHHFDIPSQPLEAALKQFALQSDLEILFAPQDAKAKHSPGVKGEYPVPEALRRLLEGTRLQYRVTSAASIVIEEERKATQTSFPDDDGMRLDGEGPLRLAQADTQNSPTVIQNDQPQTASGDTASRAGPDPALEEIVVTAQRREESLRNVPISISVYSGEQIESNRIETLQDYLELTPNVSFSSRGTSTSFDVGIRGISNIGGASNVFGVYVDEFNVAPGSANTTFDQRLVDVQRLEVLRGPQGTFFGRNVSGGAINITTRKPSADFEAFALAEVANDDGYILRSSINAPLADRLFARVSAYGEHFGGFLKNDGASSATNDRKQYGARAALRYLPTERVTADLSLSYSSVEQGFPNIVPTGTLNDLLGSFGLDTVPVGAGYYPRNRDHIETDLGLRDEARTLIATGRIEYEGDGISVISITGLIDSDTLQRGEGDHSPLSFWFDDGYDDMRSWSTELRVQSNGDSRWQWMAGAIYARDKVDTFFNRSFGPAWFFDLLGLPPDYPIPSPVSANNDFHTDEIASYALFGELSWTGLDDRLRLSLSSRFQHDEIDQTVLSPRRSPFPPFEESLDDFAGSASFDNVMPRFAATYKLTEDVTGYAVISNGVKPGGYNLGTEEVPGSPSTFNEEKLWNYEVGLKGSLLSNRLRYSLSAFQMSWDQIQVAQFYIDPDTLSAVNLTLNGTSASSKGVELELAAALTERLRLSAGVGYNDARFDDFREAIVSSTGDIADVSGNRLPLSTEWTGSAAAEYRHPAGAAGDAFLRLEYIYRGDTYSDLDNRNAVGDLIPAYDLWNVRLGFENERYSLVAFVDNVTDENFVSGWVVGSAMTGIQAVVNPRVWGLRAMARFH